MIEFITAFRDDRDGKVYKTVKIGNQVWMAENLNYAAEGSVCYDNDDSNGEIYGRLYDWETAKKACPDGWHLPKDSEWQTLIYYVGKFEVDESTALVDYAGGYERAGTKLKSATGWNDYKGKSGNGTDDYGFTALPGGYGDRNGCFYQIGKYGYWWGTEFYPSYVMGYNDVCGGEYCLYNGIVYRCPIGNANLLAVRCVQDGGEGYV